MSPAGQSERHARANRAVAIVPARLESTRLQRKMLLRETGRHLFEHTVANVTRCARIERVVLATDSEEVLEAASESGVEVLLTSRDHPSGTDRVHEALELLTARGEGPWDVVVNVQGDEPELPPEDLDTLVAAFEEPSVEIATLFAPVEEERVAMDPAVVKVVLDAANDALYFSRAPIPSLVHPSRPMRSDLNRDAGVRALKRHVGVYAYRPDALARFCALPVGALEATESLEQLRWLEAGGRIRCVEASRTTIGIDTREHYDAFVARTSTPPLEGSKTS